MKLLIEKRKWTLAIFFVFLMFFGTHLLGSADVTPVSERTPQVRDAIVATVPGINAAADITEAHLAAITTLNIRSKNIATLKADDFDGLTALSNLNLYGNHLRRLPDGLFEGLTALTTLRLGGNAMDPLPMPVTLKKVAEGQFKAVAPIGATFDYGLSITVTNGSITGGTPTVTIPHGRVESETLTVARTPNTTGEVTVDIQMLPRLPSEHYGYALVTSDPLPLSVIPKINTAPVFIDGRSTTRSVAENTDAGTAIGAAIPATDAENDTLIYTLSGADASAFDIDTATGQLKTKAELDYETQNVWTLTITVSDGSFTDTITVTITVTDIDETVNTAPSFYEGESTTRAVFENTAVGLNIGTPVLATDSPDDFLRYTLGGVHADAFAIDTATGQLKTKAPLDYETQRLYTVTITVEDEALSDTITVIISVMDVNDTVSSPGFLPVIERTPEVRDAIVAAVPNATDAATVTEAEVAAITTLNLRSRGISFLKTGDFSGMTALSNLNLYGNHLSSLPPGIFTGVPALTTLRLGGNVLDPLPLIVSLQRVDADAFKAVMPTGAPFNIVLPIGVTGSTIRGGVTSVMIPQGRMESSPFTVIGTGTGTPQVAFRRFPRLPFNHYGYTIAQSTVCNRTEQVAAAIAAAVGVEDCSTVAELDLAAITSLDLSNAALTALKAGDFDGMLSLRTLSLEGNALTRLPRGIFDDLVSLTELSLNANQLTTLPTGVFDGTPYLRSLLLSHNNLTSLPAGIFEGLTALDQLHLRWNPDAASQLPLVIALEKVGMKQFKAVVPTGAPFEITLPIKVANGSLVDGATALLIPKGSVESLPATLTRTPNTIDAVTVAIETPLPMHPATHNGYVLVTSATRPLEVIEQINVPPVFTEGADTLRTIAENVATDTNVGAPVTATDANKGTTLTYRLDDGTDADAFDIDSETGQLKTKASLDFETKKTYAVTLTASDGELTGTLVVTINVSDVNEAPVFAVDSLTTHTVTENTPAGENIGTPYKATDVDADTLTYRLDDGADAAAFDIDSETGQLKTKASLDFETKKTYAVTLTASDGELTGTLAATINISDVNEAPVFAADSLTTHAVAENTPAGQNIGTPYKATDVDADTLTYRLDVGADAAAFDIDSKTGQLKTKASLDFETQKTYAVTLTVSDGKLTGTLAATINISDVNEAPAFATDSLTTHAVAENTPAGENIGTPYRATDADADTLTYRLDDGTDAAAFDIDSETGQLKTKAALDFETKKTYAVTITVSDGEFTDTITVTIDVTDVEENRDPTFTEGSTTTRSIPENTPPSVNIGSAVSATDPDEDTLTYSLGGTDADAFDINSTSGQLQTKAHLDYHLDYEWKSSYSVTVSVSDGNNGTDSITVTINIINVVKNRRPTFTEGSTATRSIPENTPAGENIGDAVSATDPGDTLTYSLGGTDADAFDIDSTSGQLQTKAPLDYETKSSYSVTVSVSDRRGRSRSITVTINIENVVENRIENVVENQAPTFTDGSTTTRSIPENTPPSVNIGSAVSATDPGDTLTYTLGGTDAASFLIGSTSGQLQTKAPLDYETKSSYSVTVSVSDGNSGTDSITVTINIENVVENRIENVVENQAPTFTDGSTTTRSIPENTPPSVNIGSAVSATDPGDTLTYSLGGTDAASFQIVSTSGQLQTKAPLDYETKDSYSVTVSVSDGRGRSNSITVTINVIDQGPTFDASTAIRSVLGNKAANSNIGDPFSATSDPGTTLTYSLSGTDAASFQIGSTSGQLQTGTADLTYSEAKLSYSVTLTATDSNSGSSSIAVTINVIKPVTGRTSLVSAFIVNAIPGVTDPADVTEAHLRSIDQLYLTASGIATLNSGDFDGLTDLTILHLTSNSLTSLPDGIFDKNTKLITLYLNSNELPALPAGIFDKNTKLTTLILGDNSLTELPAGIFDKNTQLTTLILGDNSLTELPAGIFNKNTKLATLDLGNNNITDMSALENVTSLTHLYVKGNPISDYAPLQPHATAIQNVREDLRINLNNNPPVFTDGTSTTRSVIETSTTGTNIGTAVGATDEDTSHILTYTLGGTDAASFSIVGTSGQLKTKAALVYETKTSYTVTVTVNDANSGGDRITVTINVIKPVADRTSQVSTAIVAAISGVTDPANVTLAHLRSINSLDLFNKSIASLTSGDFDGLTELTTLRLAGNSLTALPDGIFDKNTKLTTIHLGANSLPELPDGIFDKNTKLKNLYLVTNKLPELPDGIFDKNTELMILNLADNKLPELPDGIFDKNTKLTEIYLHKNALTTLRDGIFDKNTKLTTLRLGTNKLTELRPGIFDKNTELKILNLFTNKLTALPAGIFDKNTKLTEIYLHKNALTTLPAHVFDKNTKLTTLRLNDNNITDMSAFATVTSTTHSQLTHLYVKENPISSYVPLLPHAAAIQATGAADLINLSNNPPEFTDGDSTTRAVAENTTTGTNIGAVVAATDADTTDTLTYTLGGTDVASFSIVSNSGQLQTSAALDYETKTSYTVTVTVYDGNSGGDRITVTINVTDVAGAAPSVDIPPAIPDKTVLLTNFPNPFNPETWIPYQLAKPAKVTLTLYDIRGVVVRELKLGHQAAGFYHSRSRAIHWDGRNMFGEKVATGLYFYTLKAGDYTATRKMLIRK